jgi:hypothetical protein
MLFKQELTQLRLLCHGAQSTNPSAPATRCRRYCMGLSPGVMFGSWSHSMLYEASQDVRALHLGSYRAWHALGYLQVDRSPGQGASRTRRTSSARLPALVPPNRVEPPSLTAAFGANLSLVRAPATARLPFHSRPSKYAPLKKGCGNTRTPALRRERGELGQGRVRAARQRCLDTLN